MKNLHFELQYKKDNLIGTARTYLPSGIRYEEEYLEHFSNGNLKKIDDIILHFFIEGVNKSKCTKDEISDFFEGFIKYLKEASSTFTRLYDYFDISISFKNLKLTDIHEIGEEKFRNRICELNFKRCRLENSKISEFTNLRSFWMKNCTGIFDDMFKNSNFKYFTLENVKYKGTLNSLSSNSSLENMRLVNTSVKDNLRFLMLFKKSNIKELELYNCGNIDAKFLLCIKGGLRDLIISEQDIKNIDVIKSLLLESCGIFGFKFKEYWDIKRSTEFFKIISEIEGHYKILSFDGEIKKALEKSKSCPKDELVDHRGVSFHPFG